MRDLLALRSHAQEIFNESLHSADAHAATRRAVQLEGSSLKLVETTFDLATEDLSGIYSIALGKAARPMAAALTEVLGEHLLGGVLTAPAATDIQTSDEAKHEKREGREPARASLFERWRVFEGGHPLPNRASLDAALAAFELLRRAERERALVIFLISGGGSALMEWPRDEATTLEEMQQAHRALVVSGASIAEINTVRRALSAVKGGGLARLAQSSAQVSLIISDTNAGEEASVASGPTFDSTVDTTEEVAAIIARYNLRAELPASIQRALRRPLEKAGDISTPGLRKHYVLLDNQDALRAAERAARARGFLVEIAHDVSEQHVAEGCSLMLSQLFALQNRADALDRGVCLISGGEFACPVRGPGLGGRNSESVLRLALELESGALERQGVSHLIALSAGTDGVDGNSPAAGAICDEKTISRARTLKLDAQSFLDESNAYTFFRALDDAIITGQTETNVRDVRILLAS